MVLSDKAKALKKINGGIKVKPEEIATTLCAFIETVTLEKVNKKSLKKEDKEYDRRRCPKKPLCTCRLHDGVISVEKGSGYSNYITHILPCVYGGNREAMMDAFWEAKVWKRQATMDGYVVKKEEDGKLPAEPNLSPLTDADKEMYKLIKMIVCKNWPLNCVEDEMYRDILDFQNKFSIKTVREVMLVMTWTVTDLIKAEMKKAGRGSITHDGWSKYEEHLLCVFAHYRLEREELEGESFVKKDDVIASLLSVSPLHKLAPVLEDVEVEANDVRLADMDISAAEASAFTAEIHADQIRDVLENMYGVKIKEWLTNQTADSCSVNLKLARLLGIPHVNCNPHLLHNEVETWLDETRNGRGITPGKVVDDIHTTMVSLKTNKNSACLRKLTELKATICNKTRWEGKRNMVVKFGKLKDFIVEADEDMDSDIALCSTTHTFTRAVEKTERLLNDIGATNRTLQERNLKLADGQERLNDLIRHANTTDKDDQWYESGFGSVYISPDSDKRPSKTFMKAVCKVQNGREQELTPEERNTVSKWLPNKAVETDTDGRKLTLAESIANEKKGGKRTSSAITDDDRKCLDHVICSAAEPERLWSEARYILTTQRARMAPIMLEAILFLRFNKRLWDERTVMIARSKVREEQREERLAKKARLAEEQDMNSDD